MLHFGTQIFLTSSMTLSCIIIIAISLRFFLRKTRGVSHRWWILTALSAGSIGIATFISFLSVGLAHPTFRSLFIFLIQKLVSFDSISEAKYSLVLTFFLFSLAGFCLFVFLLFRAVRHATNKFLQGVSFQILEVNDKPRTFDWLELLICLSSLSDRVIDWIHFW